MTEQNEPSMEAILASIRSILAEEEEEEEKPNLSAEQSRPAQNPNPEQKTEIKEESVPNSEPQSDLSPEQKEDDVVEPVSNNVPETMDTSVSVQEKLPEESVLDLTADMIVNEQKTTEETKNENSLSSEEDEDDDFVPEPVIPQEPMKEETLTDLIKETAEHKLDEEMLLAEPTVMAATESLSHLRDIAAERQLNLGNGSLTIEAIVRETIKPYLKEWLDTNLPEIVERVVRKEVAHIMDRLDLK